MLKKIDIAPMHPDHEDVEYYKSLAILAERRARDIRRIAALDKMKIEQRALAEAFAEKTFAAERAQLERKCARLKSELAAVKEELRDLKQTQKRIASSRAHRLAEAYVQHALSKSLFGRILRFMRSSARIANNWDRR